jgi:cellobiose phosphorylase
MNRRKFLGTAAVGGSSILGSRLGATSPLAESPQSSRQTKSTAQLRKSSGQGYFEFSPDGTECIIKRADTPMPWMNLLTNDVFQTWVTHLGNIECFLLDRGLNGLVNPQEISGYLYVRDHETGQYFMLNKPKPGGSWQAKHGLGHTIVSAGSHGLMVSVTYFVPRNDNVLIWLITLKNTLARSRTVDLFSTVEWSLGD